MTEFVPAIKRWATNSHLIHSAYLLGYVTGQVYDATPGRSALWSKFLLHLDSAGPERPAARIRLLDGIESIEANWQHQDFRHLAQADETYDTVFFDPPYKLNGTPAMGEMDARYGVDVPKTEIGRLVLMKDGLVECGRVVKKGGHVLAKCQDQVCSGRMVWQTDQLTQTAADNRLQKVDRFDMIGHEVQQPPGRTQKHAYGRGSTLLVFRRV